MTINYKFRQMHDSYCIGNEVISCLKIKTEITLLSLTFLFHMGGASTAMLWLPRNVSCAR